MPQPTYYLTSQGYIWRTADSALIPNDPSNQDFQLYQQWVSEGNTAQTYVAPQDTAEVNAKKTGG